MKQALIIVAIQNDYFPGGKMALLWGHGGRCKKRPTCSGAVSCREFADFPSDVGIIQHLSDFNGQVFF